MMNLRNVWFSIYDFCALFVLSVERWTVFPTRWSCVHIREGTQRMHVDACVIIAVSGSNMSNTEHGTVDFIGFLQRMQQIFMVLILATRLLEQTEHSILALV